MDNGTKGSASSATRILTGITPKADLIDLGLNDPDLLPDDGRASHVPPAHIPTFEEQLASIPQFIRDGYGSYASWARRNDPPAEEEERDCCPCHHGNDTDEGGWPNDVDEDYWDRHYEVTRRAIRDGISEAQSQRPPDAEDYPPEPTTGYPSEDEVEDHADTGHGDNDESPIEIDPITGEVRLK